MFFLSIQDPKLSPTSNQFCKLWFPQITSQPLSNWSASRSFRKPLELDSLEIRWDWKYFFALDGRHLANSSESASFSLRCPPVTAFAMPSWCDGGVLSFAQDSSTGVHQLEQSSFQPIPPDLLEFSVVLLLPVPDGRSDLRRQHLWAWSKSTREPGVRGQNRTATSPSETKSGCIRVLVFKSYLTIA